MLEHLTSNVFISPVDAGFGLSQLLPILVEMFMRENSLILIEQPELHLHPRLQARMGQLFRNAVLGWNHNRFIVETHSEHLVLRIRSLIRKRLLSPDLVKVLYVNNQEFSSDDDSLLGDDAMFTTLSSQVLSLRLDEYGDFIDPWPNGFFDERFQEMSTSLSETRNPIRDDETGGFGLVAD
jgi:predicted ATPase